MPDDPPMIKYVLMREEQILRAMVEASGGVPKKYVMPRCYMRILYIYTVTAR